MPGLPKSVKERIAAKKKTLGDHNTALITEFISKCAAMPSEPGESRLLTITTRIQSVARMLNNRPLDDLKEKDLQDLNLVMRERGMKAARDYRKVLKTLLILKDKKKYIDLIDSPYMKNPKNKNAAKLVDADTFLTEQQVNKYLEECKAHSPRMSAWGGLLVSTGERPHELFFMHKLNIVREEQPVSTVLVRVLKGKTGKRSILFQGAEADGLWFYLKDYLATLQDNDLLFPVSYNAMLKIHRSVCKRIRIGADKKQNFYIFRKMALTKFYNTYGLAKAASMSGHVPGSNSMKNYVDMSEEMLKDKTLPGVQMKTCPNCNTVNEPHYNHCQKCQAPLDRAKYAELFRKNTEELIDAKIALLKQEVELRLAEKGRGKP